MAKTHGTAFLLYGMSLKDATYLRETMRRFTGVSRVKAFDKTTRGLMREHKPFFVDISGHSFPVIRGLQESLARANYRTYIYIKESPLPKTLTEAWMNQQATYGMMRQHLTNGIVVRGRGLHALVEHVERVLGEAKGKTLGDIGKCQVMCMRHGKWITTLDDAYGHETYPRGYFLCPKCVAEGLPPKQCEALGMINPNLPASLAEDTAPQPKDTSSSSTPKDTRQVKPKEPSEVDRLKVTQKQELLTTKQRQSDDVLQAQQRELTLKARESQNKLQRTTAGGA